MIQPEVALLPFLKKPVANQTGVIVQNRKPDESAESQEDAGDAVIDCARDLIAAVHAQDAQGAATAIRAAFALMEMEPSDEAGDSEDFDSQNAKAAKGPF